MDRYLETQVRADLSEKMVFLSGPRQVGKTTLSFAMLKGGAHSEAYLNWDMPGVSQDLVKGILPTNQSTIVFDEIHKYPRWRNLVKGFYDKYKDKIRFLVTGSARLDLYRKGGDSLQGRYHHLRLHPFSLLELNSKPTKSDLDTLIKFGGFPEPLLKGNEKFHKRWQKAHLSHVVREDLRDLERVKEIGLVELLAEALPQRVGSPLSVKNLREELLVDHKTAERWITILESLYFCFRIPPYGSPKIRAVKKEQKLYLWDWSLVQDSGARFENLVASHLLKLCHFVEDTEGDTMELRFLRDADKREVDFVVLKNKTPLFGVEVKTGEKSISKNLLYFKARTPIKKWYQVHLGNKSWEKDGVQVLTFADFCRDLKIP
jgi:uncharacterized protein